jgi:hypothetical protein
VEFRNVDKPGLFIGLLTGLPAALCMWALIIAAFAFSMGWLKP